MNAKQTQYFTLKLLLCNVSVFLRASFLLFIHLLYHLKRTKYDENKATVLKIIELESPPQKKFQMVSF